MTEWMVWLVAGGIVAFGGGGLYFTSWAEDRVRRVWRQRPASHPHDGWKAM